MRLLKTIIVILIVFALFLLSYKLFILVFVEGIVYDEKILHGKTKIEVVLRKGVLERIFGNHYSSIYDIDRGFTISNNLKRVPELSLDSSKLAFFETNHLSIYDLETSEIKKIGDYSCNDFSYIWLSNNQILIYSKQYYHDNFKGFSIIIYNDDLKPYFKIDNAVSFILSSNFGHIIISNTNNEALFFNEHSMIEYELEFEKNIELLYFSKDGKSFYYSTLNFSGKKKKDAIYLFNITNFNSQKILKFSNRNEWIKLKNNLYYEDANVVIDDEGILELRLNKSDIDTIYYPEKVLLKSIDF